MHSLLKVFPLLTLTLCGCISQDYIDKKAAAVAIQETMEKARKAHSPSLSNVQYLTKPPAQSTPMTANKAPAWLQQDVRVKADNLPYPRY